MEYYIERKTNTKWIKIGYAFEPFGAWNINRDPKDVLNDAMMIGPFYKEEIAQ